jgi:hypothetical protein
VDIFLQVLIALEATSIIVTVVHIVLTIIAMRRRPFDIAQDDPDDLEAPAGEFLEGRQHGYEQQRRRGPKIEEARRVEIEAQSEGQGRATQVDPNQELIPLHQPPLKGSSPRDARTQARLAPRAGRRRG